MTRTRKIRLGIPVFTLAIALAACGGDNETPDSGTPDGGVVSDSGVTPDSGVNATLTAVEVAPQAVQLEPGETAQLVVTGTYDDGSTAALESGLVFDSSDDSIALVDTFGEITAIAQGAATITVDVGGLSASAEVTVGTAAPESLVVFEDDFAPGVAVQDFGGATNVLTPDSSEAQAGSASLKIEVPASGYAGAAFAIDTAQDLSSYDALVFWAKASAPHTVDVVGIGNDSTNTTYQAEFKAVSIGTDWARYVVPLPDPIALTSEQGLFHFAEGGDEGAYSLWLDDIRYVRLGAALSDFRPAIADRAVSLGVGATAQVDGQTLVVAVDGSDQTIEPAIGYFTFSSSAPSVATVDGEGLITAAGEGSATISAVLGGTAASGAVTVTVGAAPSEVVVFDDDYGSGVSLQDFGGATNAVSVDTTESHAGAASLRIEVPATGYTGGAMMSDTPFDLSGFDALTFWARASADLPLNVAGIGNDAANTTFQAEYNAVPLTSTWTRFVVPIPDPSKLTAEQGLFHFAEGSEDGAYTIWIDDVRFESLGASLSNPRPQIATETANRTVGESFTVNGTSVIFDVDGTDQVVSAARAYFDYTSSNTAVATVDATGSGTAIGVGSADITASLASIAAGGTLTVNVTDASVPSVAAPTPTPAAADVISLFSNAYTDVTVDTWSTSWDSADVADVQIAGDDVKQYTNLVFAGIETTSSPIDATGMTHFHLDVWTPAGTTLRVKLVDFGPDGVFGTDDTEHELTFDAASTPALTSGQWVSLDIPLSAFANMTTRGAIAQYILSGDTSTLYVDNVYFYAASTPTAPTTAAPTPTDAAADVISLFSNAYTNIAVDTWSTVWDDADVADVQVAGDDVKLYTNFVFAGVETAANPVDASAMTHFHMDVWVPTGTTFRVKLVDWGSDGNFGGGDDTEHELTFDAASTPALTTGQWVSLDIPLSAFVNMTNQTAVAQYVFSGDTPTVYVDNVYFHR